MKVANPLSIAWGYCQFSCPSGLAAGRALALLSGDFWLREDVDMSVLREEDMVVEVVESGASRGKLGGSGGTPAVGFFLR
jgi:hypothetical protein